jgi:hypothetical protein
MCTPTVQVVMMIASIAMQAKASSDMADFEEGKAEYNARVAENVAQKTISAGVEKENIQRQKTAQLLSKQRAQLGAAGVDIGSGTAFQLQEDTAMLGEADALRIRTGALEEASALMTKSELIKSEGEYAQIAGRSKVTGSILSGGAKIAGTGVADKWFTPSSVAKITPGQSFATTPIG